MRPKPRTLANIRSEIFELQTFIKSYWLEANWPKDTYTNIYSLEKINNAAIVLRNLKRVAGCAYQKHLNAEPSKEGIEDAH